MNVPIPRMDNVQHPINLSRNHIVGAILVTALVAFEIFNFDTTRYALQNLLGDISFVNLQWAAILAVAFCAIDFAGLAKVFTPQRGWDEPKEVWYLMGAWLLGATMNAIMTWWAVSLTLLEHEFGNEVLSRAQLLTYVPVFVAVLVWLTRILFIGAISVMGEGLFAREGEQPAVQRPPLRVQPQPALVQPKRQTAKLRPSGSSQRRRAAVSANTDETMYLEPEQLTLRQNQQGTRANSTRRSGTSRQTRRPGPPRAPRAGQIRPTASASPMAMQARQSVES